MSSMWGNFIKLSIFGESHSAAIGVVIDALPAGKALDLEKIAAFMARRAPNKGKASTKRNEKDQFEIVSGYFEGHTTGTPLCAIIRNTDTKSQDYDKLKDLMRPGHADYTGLMRYSGANDHRGGGHFSGRLTAPLCFAGAVAMQILAPCGVHVGGHIGCIGDVYDTPLDPVAVDGSQLDALVNAAPPVIDPGAYEKMIALVDDCRMQQDSIGGMVECAATGVPAGLGSPMFGGLENVISSLMFAVPAVKGIAFGEGFGVCNLKGSQNNDAFFIENGKIQTKTNHHGGILGGISSGMPITLQVALKPTPSIAQKQQTVNVQTNQNAELEIVGRHDACIVPRAVPCVESVLALAILDQMIGGKQL